MDLLRSHPWMPPKVGCGAPGLYIHIPFCITKCHYCSFFSVTDSALIPAFLTALAREADFYRDLWGGFDSLYIGGGTPSSLREKDLASLLGGIRAAFRFSADVETTLEVNPGDLNADMLRGIRGLGVNRLNIGCQSFDNGALGLLGRRHTAMQATFAVHLAREAGFGNIGLDLIYGLPTLAPGKNASHLQAAPLTPGKSQNAFKVWRATLHEAISLGVEHLSCYQLTLERDTVMDRMIAEGALRLPGEAQEARYFFETAGILEEAGYTQYEVSNFSRSAPFQSRHNRKYWDHTPYLGLGPGAHSFDGRRRWWNSPSVETYLRQTSEGRSPVGNEESLTPGQLALEALFLGLRTRRGIDLEGYKNRYKRDLLSEKSGIIEGLVKEGLVEVMNGFLRPTRAGMAVADSLALI